VCSIFPSPCFGVSFTDPTTDDEIASIVPIAVMGIAVALTTLQPLDVLEVGRAAF
jgi:hypothetical protein